VSTLFYVDDEKDSLDYLDDQLQLAAPGWQLKDFTGGKSVERFLAWLVSERPGIDDRFLLDILMPPPADLLALDVWPRNISEHRIVCGMGLAKHLEKDFGISLARMALFTHVEMSTAHHEAMESLFRGSPFTLFSKDSIEGVIEWLHMDVGVTVGDRQA
jgi:hypothetical protein